ncbi:MAG: nitronate monooxygenase [Deltaproteobacteria bacterium]|nr:nitronate monooxygenase [Deltaproteobacteria bacterium]MBW2181364.1 nitronate monooxygenase [Deltaproteobacteria bacterium]
MQTRLTELLGIKYPIVEASMAWITDAEMAAAVSNAGGLGTIGPNAGLKTVTADVSETGERLREQIKKCREMTDKPFAVNFVVGVVGWDRDYSDRCVKVGIDEEVPVAIISQGSPQVYTQRLKETGMKVIHVCSTVRHVKKAEAEGVDAVVVSGTEGGGHSGFDQITTFCLVPQAADAVEIPVIAGGGIADARGLVGALALGAEGIYMGTRFMATKECPTHPNVKQAVLAATDTSTIAVRHGSPAKATGQNTGDRGFVEERRGSVRMLINDYMKRIMTEKGADLTFDSALEASDEQESNPESNRTVAAFVHGDLEKNSITVGQGSGLIHDVPSCKELIERIVHEAEPVLERLNNMYKT